MMGHLLSRLACFFRGYHVIAFRFRDNAQGRSVPGYECVECLRWSPTPWGKDGER